MGFCTLYLRICVCLAVCALYGSPCNVCYDFCDCSNYRLTHVNNLIFIMPSTYNINYWQWSLDKILFCTCLDETASEKNLHSNKNLQTSISLKGKL